MLSDTMMLGGGRKAAYPMENSLLFRGAQYLSRTPSVAGNRQTFTISLWFRVCKLGVNRTLFAQGAGTQGGGWCVYLRYDDTLSIYDGTQDTRTARKFRDVTAWYHLVVSVDTREETAKDRYKMYINGVLETSFLQETYPSRYEELLFNQMGVVHRVSGDTDATLFNGHLAEPLFVDGQALPPTTFGEVDSVTGSWRPKTLAGITWGHNGFYLGKPWDSASLGTDASGNGNHWTPSGFVASDVVSDSPTNVYSTMMSVSPLVSGTFSAGNLTFTSGYADAYAIGTAAIPTSGIWCWEVQASVLSAGNALLGIVRPGLSTSVELRNLGGGNAYSYSNLATKSDGSGGNGTSYGTSFTTSDVIAVVYNASAGEISFYKNGISLGVAYSGLSGVFIPAFGDAAIAHAGTVINVNFGQRPFAYPNAYGVAKPLSTANLPATIGVTSGSFTGNANADGPCVFTGAVPLTLKLNGKSVTWGTHADKLASGFKLRTADTNYNASGTNTWTATYASPQKPTVGPKGRAAANAQANP